jgi:predicted MFS family arabinose efflux permease
MTTEAREVRSGLSIARYSVRQYAAVTASYWLFTITDGALRMLVVLHFYNLGYNPLQIAFLFLLYEAFGIVTSLFGGYIGAKFGLNRLMNVGMVLQIAALAMLMVPESMLIVVWVMAAQALSGIAKDLNKMSAKSAVKSLLPENEDSTLFKWVAVLTGSKNTLKGVGFFVGAVLLSAVGFRYAVLTLIALIVVALIVNFVFLESGLGKSTAKNKFSQVFSRSSPVNWLSAARLFLFSSRDVWFVVGLPVYFASTLQWSHWKTGAFMATWVILYGGVQAIAPHIVGRGNIERVDGRSTTFWVAVLLAVTIGIAIVHGLDLPAHLGLIPGLFVFGGVFAINSSLHSYLIVHYADRESTSIDVGFYYMANAAGRLFGTLLSGLLTLQASLSGCLLGACVLIALSLICSLKLPQRSSAIPARS